MNTDQQKKIDAALRLVSRVQPPAGLEARVHARLRHTNTPATFGEQVKRFFLVQRLALGAVAASAACAAMIVGSVTHSHQQHALPAIVIHLPAPGAGLGAASGARLAGAPVSAPADARARSTKKAVGGRATVRREAHKAGGVAVPSPAEPEKP